ARTVGMESPPDAYRGPIVPVPRPGRTSGERRTSLEADPPPPAGSPAPDRGDRHRRLEDEGPMVVHADHSLIDRMINRREVIVLDETTDDPLLRKLMDRSQKT